MKFEDTGAIMLTPKEFLKKTGIDPGNYIFETMGPNIRFYMYEAVRNRVADEPERYCYDQGEKIYEFKHMKKYGETWFRVYDRTASKPSWSLWNTWRVW